MNFGILVFSLPAFKHNQSTIAKDMSNADRYKASTNIHALRANSARSVRLRVRIEQVSAQWLNRDHSTPCISFFRTANNVINLYGMKPTREKVLRVPVLYVYNISVPPTRQNQNFIEIHVSRGILIQRGSTGVTQNQISKESLALKDHIRIFLSSGYTYSA